MTARRPATLAGLALLGELLALGGCQLAIGGGAGAVAAWLAITQSAVKDVDAGLVVVKPVNEVICAAQLKKPHGAELTAVLTAACANLPSDIGGLLRQVASIWLAAESAAPGPNQTSPP